MPNKKTSATTATTKNEKAAVNRTSTSAAKTSTSAQKTSSSAQKTSTSSAAKTSSSTAAKTSTSSVAKRLGGTNAGTTLKKVVRDTKADVAKDTPKGGGRVYKSNLKEAITDPKLAVMKNRWNKPVDQTPGVQHSHGAITVKPSTTRKNSLTGELGSAQAAWKKGAK